MPIWLRMRAPSIKAPQALRAAAALALTPDLMKDIAMPTITMLKTLTLGSDLFQRGAVLDVPDDVASALAADGAAVVAGLASRPGVQDGAQPVNAGGDKIHRAPRAPRKGAAS